MTEDTDCVNICFLKIILPKNRKKFEKWEQGMAPCSLQLRKKYLDELIELYGTPDIGKLSQDQTKRQISIAAREFVTYLQSIVFTPKESMIFTLPVQMHFAGSDLATLLPEERWK